MTKINTSGRKIQEWRIKYYDSRLKAKTLIIKTED